MVSDTTCFSVTDLGRAEWPIVNAFSSEPPLDLWKGLCWLESCQLQFLPKVGTVVIHWVKCYPGNPWKELVSELTALVNSKMPITCPGIFRPAEVRDPRQQKEPGLGLPFSFPLHRPCLLLCATPTLCPVGGPGSVSRSLESGGRPH